MALERQILLDGWRNAIVKLTGVVGPEAPAVNEVPAIALADFTNNDVALIAKGFRVDKVQYSIGDGIEVQLEWNSNSPQQIAPLAGQGEICLPGGANPDMERSGYDGSINLRTTGTPGTTENFTIVLCLTKLYWRSLTSL